MKTNTYFWSYLTQFSLEWEMFRTKVVEEIKTHILCSVSSPPPPPRKSSRLWDNVEKYCRARLATDGNMARVHCMLDTQSYRHTLRKVICIAFPLRQWLLERASMLRYVYIACLVVTETERVYCAVRTDTLNVIQVHSNANQRKGIVERMEHCLRWQCRISRNFHQEDYKEILYRKGGPGG